MTRIFPILTKMWNLWLSCQSFLVFAERLYSFTFYFSLFLGLDHVGLHLNSFSGNVLKCLIRFLKFPLLWIISTAFSTCSEFHLTASTHFVIAINPTMHPHIFFLVPALCPWVSWSIYIRCPWLYFPQYYTLLIHVLFLLFSLDLLSFFFARLPFALSYSIFSSKLSSSSSNTPKRTLKDVKNVFRQKGLVYPNITWIFLFNFL